MLKGKKIVTNGIGKIIKNLIKKKIINMTVMEEISSLIDFIKLPSVLTFSYHVPFLNIVEDQDSALSDTIGMLLASEPLLTLTPASQDTSNNDGTEDEVTGIEGQEENMLVA